MFLFLFAGELEVVMVARLVMIMEACEYGLFLFLLVYLNPCVKNTKFLFVFGSLESV